MQLPELVCYTPCSKYRFSLVLIFIVMRMLEGSNDLKDITHIVLDEVHERTIDSDFLLIVLRKLLPRRPDLKVTFLYFWYDALNVLTLSKGRFDVSYSRC